MADLELDRGVVAVREAMRLTEEHGLVFDVAVFVVCSVRLQTGLSGDENRVLVDVRIRKDCAEFVAATTLLLVSFSDGSRRPVS